jgi:hypothetical protein
MKRLLFVLFVALVFAIGIAAAQTSSSSLDQSPATQNSGNNSGIHTDPATLMGRAATSAPVAKAIRC